jgi:RNA polymerase sigma factor (sigma-70 family)
MTVNHHDAEDAVQLVQIAVWRGLDQFAGQSKFSTWLYRVTHNTTLGLLRQRSPIPVETRTEIPSNAADFATRLSDHDAIRWALAQLPDEFRSTFVLREFEGLTIGEIAEVQIISEGTVKSRLARSRQALAYLLKESDI